MFSVDEPTAAAIRRAYEEDGDLASIVEFRRHFPLITDHAKVRECVRIYHELEAAADAGTQLRPAMTSADRIASWRPCSARRR